MQISKIPFSDIPQLSQKDKDYALGAPHLRPFYKHGVKIESFSNIIDEKQKKKVNRVALIEALQQQYEGVNTSTAVRENINALVSDNTFTVTTAHQPALFTGPLYYVYKILSTINLARQLAETYPAYHFVPMFVSGAEDHDFEEINHAHLFGKTMRWEHNEKGAVGTMSMENLIPIIQNVIEMLGESENAQRLSAILRKAYFGKHQYGKAAFLFVNELFMKYGLVVLDMNTPVLKREFIPFIKEELTQQVSKSIVPNTQRELEAAGFPRQTHVRDINLFYLHEQTRNRIEKRGDRYHIVTTDWHFSESEMLELVEHHPERFSPNVVLRPVYQEVILPNLAYIGGGGEIAYWLERKAQFEHWDIPFPMLIRRNSVLWLTKADSKKMAKLNIGIRELFAPLEILIKNHVSAQAEEELDLTTEKQQLTAIYEAIKTRALKIDSGLEALIMAEQARQLKALGNLEARLHKAEKQKHEVAINQLKRLKQKLFPKNGLQERYHNFIPFYLKYGPQYFDHLLSVLDPLKKGFIIVKEE